MSYVFSGMGDHLRVGPQFVPRASRAAMVIQRGPHGQRLAPAEPSRGGPEGELRWWRETLYQPGDWVPQQKVVGVMGMGAMSGRPVAANSTKVQFTNISRAILSSAKNNPVGTMPSVISQAEVQLSQVNNFDFWSAPKVSWWGWGSSEGDWISSNEVKSNLRNAQIIARNRIAGTEAPPLAYSTMDPKTHPGDYAQEEIEKHLKDVGKTVASAAGGLPGAWLVGGPGKDDMKDLLEKGAIAAGVILGGAIIVNRLLK
jgi:hypothetical protein